MNDSTPFDTIGDGPLEARIVAWVLGEASAFEAAELERLCEERPELLVFRRRMRALHGLLTETEAAEPDDSWKLPPEKRKALDELFGEEIPARPEQERELRVRRSGRRALLAIAACLMLTLFLGAVFSSGSASIQKARRVKQAAQRSAAEDKVDFLPGGGGGGSWGGGVQAQKSTAADEFAEGENAAETRTRSKGFKDESDRFEKTESGSGIDIAGGTRFSLRKSSAGNEGKQKQLQNGANDGGKFDGSVTYGAPIVESPVATSAPVPSASPALPALDELAERITSSPSALADNKPHTESESAPVDKKSDLAFENGSRGLNLGEDAARPARARVMPGAKRELADSDADSPTNSPASRDTMSPVSGTTVDGIPADPSQFALNGVTNGLRSGDQAVNRNSIDAILNNPNRTSGGTLEGGNGDLGLHGKLMDGAESKNGSVGGFVANEEFSADQLSKRAPAQSKPAESPAAPPVLDGSQVVIGDLTSSEPATGAGGGGGAAAGFGLATGGEGRAEMDEKLKLSAASEMQPEITAGTTVNGGTLDLGGAVAAPAAAMPAPASAASLSFSGELRYKIDGPAAAPAAATPQQAGVEQEGVQSSPGMFFYADSTSVSPANKPVVGNELQAAKDMFDSGWKFTGGKQTDSGNQISFSDSELDQSTAALQEPASESEFAGEGLRSGREAVNRHGIDAIPQNPTKPAGDVNGRSDVPQQASTPADDPIRTNPALAFEHTQNVDQVRRGLYTAEGNLNLGKYDDAKHEYESVLRIDPYNSAARRGMEKVSQAKTDYYRAAYDHTRAELLMQVDNAWELKVPSEVKGDKEGPVAAKPAEVAKEVAGKDQAMDEVALEEKASKLRKEMEDPASQEGNKQAFFREWKETQNKLQEIAKTKAKAAPAKKSPLESMEEIAASEEAYSTFSLNINDASFQIAKAALDKGDRPDPAAIKVEQFYNAVDYGDPAPATNEPVAARIEQAAHPIIPGRNLVRVSLKTAAAGRGASQPLRLTLLVDQSGSMVREDRRTAMSNALKQLGGLLTPNDHITVVGFSRESHLLADNWTGEKAGKLGDLINQTASEGGTNLEQAINLGEQMAARPHPAGEQNRIVLFTDGAANLGNANPERLAERVKSLRQKGIAFDIAGIGADGVNDRLLSELARNGNGRYYVVGDTKNESFARQLAGAFRPAAENVKVQVHFNPDRVGRYKLIGFEKDRLKTEDFRNDTVDAAELAAEEAGVAIYQVETLPQGSGEIGEVSVRFRDTSKGEMVERKWTMPFESTTLAFDRATPSMQLAGLSMLAAEKLKGGPLADAIDFRQLSGSQSLVKQFYGSSPRVADMLHVIDLLK